MGMGTDDARHLLSRATFGGDPAAVRRFAAMDRAEAARALLGTARKRATMPEPDWADATPPSRRERRKNRKRIRRELRAQGKALKAWWLDEMLATPSPLTERMTLFWHNHFTSGLRKVKFTPLMYRQNVLLRRHALGSFKTLLHAAAKDPAMLIYLDGRTNHKRKPNENFAREVMELFTLGEGHYTERDIKEAARAFTGWKVDRASAEFRFVKRAHDTGTKTVLGETGAFDGDDVLGVILDQPRTAEYVVERLWAEFIATPLPNATRKRLATKLRRGDYAIAPVVEAILTDAAFYARANRGTQIKSPVELIVGTLRLFDLGNFKRAAKKRRMDALDEDDDDRSLMRACKGLGQDLFDPPNVKGWPGGEAWITSQTLLTRQNLLLQALKGMRKRLRGERDLDKVRVWLGERGLSDRETVKALYGVLLPTEPVTPIPRTTRPIELIEHALLDPAYQLK